MTYECNWDMYFEKAFVEVKMKLGRIIPIGDEGAVDPDLLALRDAVNALPCAIKILELRVNNEQHRNLEDETCQLISYDLSSLGKLSTEYCGIINKGDAEGLGQFFAKHGLVEEKSFCNTLIGDLSTVYFFDDDKPDIHFHFLFYNMRNKFDRYINDFWELIHFGSLNYPMVEKFKVKEIDYNALYNLKPDQILPLQTLVDKESELFFLGVSNIEDLQRRVADIQLIPLVTDDVRQVFNTAKKLYVFGYFCYNFFTVSDHYAYLALESAIKNRYAISLGGKAILTKAKNESYEIASPTWERISEFFHKNKKGWKISKSEINGTVFPFNMNKLLNWLVEKKIITQYERERYYDTGIFFRNTLSHLEFAPTHGPNHQNLRITAKQINKMFSNV